MPPQVRVKGQLLLRSTYSIVIIQTGGLIYECKDKTVTSAIKEKEGSGQSEFTEIKQRLRLFNTLLDSRFEDLKRETRVRTTYRDMSAGLIVALTAIPIAMGFAMHGRPPGQYPGYGF